MRLLILALLLVLVAACRVEKSADDQYKVETPPQAEEAARDVKEGASEASRKIVSGTEAVAESVKEEAREFGQSPTGQKIKEGAKQVGEGLETAAREAAVATGKGIEKAGKKIQEHAKPGDQP